MKHIHFDVESDGFYGAYWACKDRSDCTVIAMLGDDPEDYMARSAGEVADSPQCERIDYVARGKRTTVITTIPLNALKKQWHGSNYTETKK